MARRRLTAIAGALGLVAWLATSGVTAQADTPDPDATFNAMVGYYTLIGNIGQSTCFGQGATRTSGGCTFAPQTSTAHDNVAVCVEYNLNLTNVSPTEDCTISQTNSTHNNIAIVIQIYNQRRGAGQSATQTATVEQDNLTGANFAAVIQIVKQSTSASTAGVQSQTDGQSATIDQNPTTLLAASGRNLAILGESSIQSGESETGATQTQFSDQDVTDSGHHINQHSTGLSKAFAFQSQIQRLEGSGTQMQTADPKCCSFQDDYLGDVFQINQSTYQKASQLTAVQNAEDLGECKSTGHCAITQSSTNNTRSFGPTTVNCIPGSFCTSFVTCNNAGVEGGCGPSGFAPVVGVRSSALP